MKNIFYNLFLKEDAPKGDITTAAIFGQKSNQTFGEIVAKENFVLSGTKVVQDFLRKKFPRLKMQTFEKEGSRVKIKKRVVKISGPIQDLLLAERIVLNLLQRLSG